jgi:ABC-type uncharacterized transport system substrate-binding protein
MKTFKFYYITLIVAITMGTLSVSGNRPGIILATEAPESAYKILHIMSYHSPWRWTDGQLNGFKEALKDQDIEYRVFQMDTKRHSDNEWKRKKGSAARDLINRWKPDLVYTTDDDAQTYVTQYWVNKKTPFVFSGVNKPPEVYGFTGSRNITGVLEHELFVESVRLLKDIVPNVRRIAVVFDEASMWRPVMKRMKEKSAGLDGVELVSLDTIKTFAEYKQKIRAYHQTADAIALIGIFNFKNEQGSNVPYQDILRWTAENSRLPDFSFWSSRVHSGTLCAVNVSPYKQGMAAGRIARAILTEGKSPSAFPMKPSMKGYPIVSLARANKLGIRIKSKVLLTAEVIQRFEWQQE